MNNNLRLFEDLIKLCSCDPSLLRNWLSMYGVKVTLLIPNDSTDVNRYHKVFGNYALDNNEVNYNRIPTHMLINNMDWDKIENGFDTDVIIYYPEKIDSTSLIEMEFMHKQYLFNVVPNSIETYNNLVYRFGIKLNNIQDLGGNHDSTA